MLLIYLVRLNINESQCNWLWIKVNQSEWHKFQLIQLIEIDQIEKKQFQWTGSIHWQEAIDTIESIDATWQWKTNWLTPRNQACLSKSTPKTNRSICLTWRWCIFEPSMTPFLVGYLSIDTIESSEICGYKKPLLKQSPCLLIQVVNWATSNMSHVPHCIIWNNLSLKMLETNTQRIIDITSAASDDMTHPSLT